MAHKNCETVTVPTNYQCWFEVICMHISPKFLQGRRWEHRCQRR